MKKNRQAEWSAAWREAMTATSLGWDLALPIFGGVLLGYLLDQLKFVNALDSVMDIVFL